MQIQTHKAIRLRVYNGFFLARGCSKDEVKAGFNHNSFFFTDFNEHKIKITLSERSKQNNQYTDKIGQRTLQMKGNEKQVPVH